MTDAIRKNGFQRPFHPLQLVSWVVFGSDVALFAFLCLPILGGTASQVLVGACFFISVSIVVIGAAFATACDPSDPHIRDSADADSDNDDNRPFCAVCNTGVFDRSKHCRDCNRCVEVFDHHCMWLNNCIGKANYRWFLVTVSSVAVMTGIVIACCFHLVILYATDDTELEDRLNSFTGLPKEAALVFLCILVLVNGPLFLLDLQLVLLHVFLTYEDITTYEYIVRKREQQAMPSGSTDKTFLPQCMDWIVFRPRKKRKQDASAAIEKIPEGAHSTEPDSDTLSIGSINSATRKPQAGTIVTCIEDCQKHGEQGTDTIPTKDGSSGWGTDDSPAIVAIGVPVSSGRVIARE